MKTKLISFLILLSSAVALSQPCKDVLKKKLDMNDLSTLKENFEILIGCKKYNFDEFDLQKSTIGSILIKLSTKKKNDEITFKDLVDAYVEMRKTPAYQEARDIFYKAKYIAEKAVSLDQWEEDKKILLSLDFDENACQKIKQIIQDTFKNEGSNLKITYSEILEIYNKKFPPPSLKDIHAIDNKNRLTNDDFEKSMISAKNENKLVLVYFTGYGVVNGRKMEETILINPQVIDKIQKEFVFTVLYVDDRTLLSPSDKDKYSQLYGVEITTIGKLNLALQKEKFNTMFQPYFVIITSEGKNLEEIGYVLDTNIFLQLLENAIKKNNH